MESIHFKSYEEVADCVCHSSESSHSLIYGSISYISYIAPPRCRTSQYCRIFIPLSVSLWNDLSDPVFDGVAPAGFKSRANAFLLAYLLAHFLSPAVFAFSSFILWVGVVGFGSSD